MKLETTVVIAIDGVRVERLPRLKQDVKTHLRHFGREITVYDGVEEDDAEQAVREIPE